MSDKNHPSKKGIIDDDDESTNNESTGKSVKREPEADPSIEIAALRQKLEEKDAKIDELAAKIAQFEKNQTIFGGMITNIGIPDDSFPTEIYTTTLDFELQWTGSNFCNIKKRKIIRESKDEVKTEENSSEMDRMVSLVVSVCEGDETDEATMDLLITTIQSMDVKTIAEFFCKVVLKLQELHTPSAEKSGDVTKKKSPQGILISTAPISFLISTLTGGPPKSDSKTSIERSIDKEGDDFESQMITIVSRVLSGQRTSGNAVKKIVSTMERMDAKTIAEQFSKALRKLHQSRRRSVVRTNRSSHKSRSDGDFPLDVSPRGAWSDDEMDVDAETPPPHHSPPVRSPPFASLDVPAVDGVKREASVSDPSYISVRSSLEYTPEPEEMFSRGSRQSSFNNYDKMPNGISQENSEVDGDSSYENKDSEVEMKKYDEKEGKQKEQVHSNSMESQLLKTVLEVSEGKQTVERAMQKMKNMTNRESAKSIATVFSKAFLMLPRSDSWHLVNIALLNIRQMKKTFTMSKAEKIERSKVWPKAERHFFELLKAMLEIKRFKGIFDCFYEYFRDNVFVKMNTSSPTAEVTRNVRCLIYALAATDRTSEEKRNNARFHFRQILKEQRSQAVCRSLDAEVLSWATDRFANTLSNYRSFKMDEFRKPATLKMVHDWWNSDMKKVERGVVKQQPIEMIRERMSNLLSPNFKFDGLDRVKLLTQLVSFDSIDRVIPTSSFKEGLDGADQRKALQLHLRNSTKQVAVFLKRPICQDAGAREHKQFSSFISTLEEWLRMARKVMKKYAKNTSDSEESSGEEDEAESGEETEE